MKKIAMMMLVLVVSFLVLSCIPAAEQCSVDADCVPAQCCHPTGAVTKADAPDCSATLCTASCEGPLDCGAGEIKCLSNKCSVVSLS